MFHTVHLLPLPQLRWHPQCLFRISSFSLSWQSVSFPSATPKPKSSSLTPLSHVYWHVAPRFLQLPHSPPLRHLPFLLGQAITISTHNCRLLVSALASPILWFFHFAFGMSPCQAYLACLSSFSIYLPCTTSLPGLFVFSPVSSCCTLYSPSLFGPLFLLPFFLPCSKPDITNTAELSTLKGSYKFALCALVLTSHSFIC